MNPNLKANFLSLLYTTWLHNNFAIAMVIGVFLTAAFLIFKPKRKYVFFLLGFLLLLVGFEYQKHFAKALEEQTIRTMLIENEDIVMRNFFEDFFQKAVSFFLWLAGWGLVFLGIVI